MHEIIDFIVNLVGTLGYFGIFFMMFLESSFFPFPSEVVMIPAGYLAHKGEMNIFIAIFCGILGSLAGALFNYVITIKGRNFIIKFGSYFFFKESTLLAMEGFFKEHGEVTTFLGRLIPVLRQYISLPAGLARMNLFKFCLYTSLGAGIWVAILAIFGFMLGGIFEGGLSMEELMGTFTKDELSPAELTIKSYLRQIIVFTLAAVAIVCAAYIYLKKKSTKKETKKGNRQ